jgi:uncharacterized membrane protein YkoI
MTQDKARGGARRGAMAAALLVGGLVAGGVTAGALTANAASSDTSATSSATSSGAASTASNGSTVDESKSQRPDEHLLTGDTATQVKAAALAKYPGAAVLRVETDSDGVYEAHLTTTDGKRVTVEVNKSFAVTGLEAAPAGGPGGGRAGGPAGGSGGAQQGQQAPPTTNG